MGLRRDVSAVQRGRLLNYTDLLSEGARLFNAGEFFDCHEVWEEAWTPERGPRRLFLQSLIHMAVALHHHHNGNPIGAERQFRKGLRKLAGYLPRYDGVATLRLYEDAQECLEAVLRGAPLTNPKIEL